MGARQKFSQENEEIHKKGAVLGIIGKKDKGKVERLNTASLFRGRVFSGSDIYRLQIYKNMMKVFGVLIFGPQ